MGEFRMPSLGADMVAGTLVAFRVPVGGRIHKGDIFAEVETEKGVIEVESFEEGIIERYLVEPGRKVPVGTPLAILGGADAVAAPPTPLSPAASAPSPPPSREPSPPPPSREPEPEPEAETAYGAASRITAQMGGPLASPSLRRRARELGIPLEELVRSSPYGRAPSHDLRARGGPSRPEERPPSAPEPPAAIPPAGVRESAPEPPPATPLAGVGSTAGRLRASPLARRRAHELGVRLEGLAGTGPAQSVVLRDVERAAEQAQRTTPARTARERMQHAVAEAMSRANREIPHYYLTQTIDLGEALRFLARHNEAAPIDARLVPALLFVRAVARAVKKVPGLNGFRHEDRTELVPAAHVGVAIALRGGGLVAPALLDADQGTLDELMRRFTDLVSRAKQGALRSSEMGSATLTVTSLGERGVESVLPIIFPPQIAMVGFGTVVDRPWAVAGEVVVRPVVSATLAADHRVSNGHEGARFLAAIADQLGAPEAL